MLTRSTRFRLAAGGVALLTLGGITLAPAVAHRPSLVEALLGRYIVTLQDSVADPAAVAQGQAGLLGGTVDRVFASALKGYSASLPAAVLAGLRADPTVKAVEPDARVTLSASQVNPPYGIDRIDQRYLPLNRSYAYATGGAGVQAYVLDTGVRRDHPEFAGRVAGGFNVLDRSADTRDCNGHGTHVSGILASSTYGVAKAASVVPVKIFGCGSSTTLSAILAGLDWATADHRPGQKAVANLSFDAGPSFALDRAITALSNDGVAVAVAAGNESVNACGTSPARVPQVLTVAASDQRDAMARFSNGGSCVDLFAPGVGILSADSRSNGSFVMSGTSMAAPHVAGALARELSAGASTAQLAQSRVLGRATPGVITGTGQRCALLSGCRPGTPNLLLFTG